jgi:hypothetical protein
MTYVDVVKVVVVGIGATAVMDAWSQALRHLSVPTLDYALVGRWVGHMRQGKFAHASIGQATVIPCERALGWIIHYLTGIAFAALLAAMQGVSWLQAPSWMPAITVGLATAIMPLFVMQPAMGAGVMASRTPTPLKNCLRSIATHVIFGAGLYLSATLMTFFEL